MRHRFCWNFDIRLKSENITFPSRFLWIDICFEQAMTVLFVYHSVNDIAIPYIVIVSLLVLDIFFISQNKVRRIANKLTHNCENKESINSDYTELDDANE